MDYSLVFERLLRLMLEFSTIVGDIWSFLNKTHTISFFGFELLKISPLGIFSGAGISALFVWWLFRG